jgi:hypothetical protein
VFSNDDGLESWLIFFVNHLNWLLILTLFFHAEQHTIHTSRRDASPVWNGCCFLYNSSSYLMQCWLNPLFLFFTITEVVIEVLQTIKYFMWYHWRLNTYAELVLNVVWSKFLPVVMLNTAVILYKQVLLRAITFITAHSRTDKHSRLFSDSTHC